MHDARDAEDRRLFEVGEHKLLVEGYWGIILDRCRARVPRDAAEDVAVEVAVRLLDELGRGKRYPAPFRVVVHMVTSWKIKEFFTRKPSPGFLGQPDPAAEDPELEAVESDYDLLLLMNGLAPREREVVDLRWRQGLEIGEIAARLGLDRNAVDQALFRAHAKLRARLAA
jgi:RNA polymerase sigma-70 factor (ECF subfamily)